MTLMQWLRSRWQPKSPTEGWTAQLCEFGNYTPERSYEASMSPDGKLEVTFTALHDVPVHQQIALSYGIHTSTPESRAAAHDWSAHPGWPPEIQYGMHLEPKMNDERDDLEDFREFAKGTPAFADELDEDGNLLMFGILNIDVDKNVASLDERLTPLQLITIGFWMLSEKQRRTRS